MPDPALRCFVALWPGPATRAALAAAQTRWSWPRGARPVPPDKIHLTLHFIGALPAARLGDLQRAIAFHAEPFTLILDRAAVWRNGVAVLEASAPPPALPALHARLAEALRSIGLPVEDRDFRPHVTLARDAKYAAPPAVSPLSWPVRRHVLVLSEGGRYRVLPPP